MNDVYFCEIAVAICEAAKNKRNPNAVDVIREFINLIQSNDTIYVETTEEGLKRYNILTSPKYISSDPHPIIVAAFNTSHGQIHELLDWIQKNEPDFEVAGCSDILNVALCKERKTTGDTKRISYRTESQLGLPEFLRGFASPSSPLSKFRKSALFDPNINRIIASFLGEKKKRVPVHHYLFNQILEYRLLHPKPCKSLVATVMEYEQRLHDDENGLLRGRDR